MRTILVRTLMLTFACSIAACSSTESELGPEEAEAIATPVYESALPQNLRAIVDKPFTGDLDAMMQRRIIRVAAPFNRTHYFIDRGVQRGLSYEYVKMLEDQLNSSRGPGAPKIHVLILPIARDMLLPALEAGKVDMVVAQLTVTPERMLEVDFTHPTRANVNEILVTGKDTRPIASLEDFAGRQVFVRRSSSYHESLQRLNQHLQMEGEPPVIIRPISESLEDDDLLEMVNAGLIPATVVDDYLAEFWKKVLGDIVLHELAPVRIGGKVAVAIRKNSPQLAAMLNDFIDKNGLDTTIGRILSRRYLQNTQFALSATSGDEVRRFSAMVELFRKYGSQYDLDSLLMAAQGFQESRLDQDARSKVGAIGVMQLMPETGREQNVGDIRQLEPNVHAGTKYMRTLVTKYYEREPMDSLNKELFAFASYNAGPARIRQLRRETAARGLNPNVWFGNVEQIASERIGRETVTYVSNIYKYYIAYSLVSEQMEQRTAAKSSLAAR